MPPAMSRGIITLIPKKAKTVVPKDFRSITLLNVDAKTLDWLMMVRVPARRGDAFCGRA